jgi:phosphatidylethanolamine N-methyltransferase
LAGARHPLEARLDWRTHLLTLPTSLPILSDAFARIPHQIYRLDACKSTLVTRISSAGKWVPIHADQYDGEIPISDEDDDATGSTSASVASGTVTLKGNALPWNAGSYELRYHHDGKHNVMARLAPLEIFVPRPEDPMSLSSVQEILTRIVTLALDSDSSLVPQSSIATPQPVRTPTTAGGGSVSPMQAVRGPASTLSPVGGRAAPATIDGEALHAASEASAADDQADAHDPLRRALSTISSDNASTALATDDPDDFTIMSAVQAERLVKGIRLAFDVDFTTAVVVAQPNVRELAERIVGSLKVLARDSGDGGSGGGAGPGTGQRPLGTRALSSGSASADNGDSGGIGSRS